MNYTVSGIFSVKVRAESSAAAREAVGKMLRKNKIRYNIIEITEEGELSESGKKEANLQLETIW